MKPEPKTRIREIGKQLDFGLFPVVYNRGIVRPNGARGSSSTNGQEMHHEAAESSRPATRPWQWSPRGQGAPGRSRSAGAAAPVVSSQLRSAYGEGLKDCARAYPTLEAWDSEREMWLMAESAIIDGLGRTAFFLLHLPYSRTLRVRGWGFWKTAVSRTWIGPRHTNFPDGSICAFEIADGTWKPGDSPVALLDLYTVWAARHLHLESFGRWPGFQSVPLPAERICEIQDDEFCGCGNFTGLYRDCCKPGDLRETSSAEMIGFWGFQRRHPPLEIMEAAWRQKPPYLTAEFLAISSPTRRGLPRSAGEHGSKVYPTGRDPRETVRHEQEPESGGP